MESRSPFFLAATGISALALSLACGGGSGGPAALSTGGGNGTVAMSMSDASTEDWATIGVKLLGIALVPQGGSASSAVTVYKAPTPAPTINLVQLDQLSEILGNVQVAAGTYTQAILTLSANPGDVYLTSAADPSASFAGAPSTTYGQGANASQVQIQGATGATGGKTVTATVNLVQPLVVSANANNSLDLEFDLSHPAFIVGHVTAAAQSLVWAVDFNGPMLRHHPCRLTDMVLRHLYGTVTAVSTDNTALTLSKDYPTWPIVSPETENTSSVSLPVLADATNGTLFFNLDSSPITPATVQNFSSLATLLAANSAAGKTTFVRVVTRYQSNGTLVAARVYTSTSFNTIFINPEGHVLHVSGSGASPTFTVENDNGQGVKVNVTAATNFYFHTPASATAGVTPISGSGGVTFMNDGFLARGFKVHTTVDPTTMDAIDVDIEIAKYDGVISSANTSSFDYTHAFATASDDYTDFNLPYIASTVANGIDPSTGDPYLGFKWWNLGYPTLLNPGSSSTVTAIQSFVAAVSGSATFGGTPAINAVPYGVSYSLWNGTAATPGWDALFTIAEPTPLPLGSVSTAWSLANGTATFQMTVPNGTQAMTVDLNTASGSAPLVYQIDRTNGVVTVNPVDITTPTGQATAAAGLVSGAAVKAYGVPQSSSGKGYLMAYVVFYYTGTASTM